MDQSAMLLGLSTFSGDRPLTLLQEQIPDAQPELAKLGTTPYRWVSPAADEQVRLLRELCFGAVLVEARPAKCLRHASSQRLDIDLGGGQRHCIEILAHMARLAQQQAGKDVG